MKLLTRTEFKTKVFKRDNNKCIVCKSPAVDAHHLIERRLFSDSGYYIDNGVSLCSNCHFYAEDGTFTVEWLRQQAGITNIVLPNGFSPDVVYDKWGKFMEQRYKHPRIFHFPWSDGLINDDKRIESIDAFVGQEVSVTLKMDGENSTIYWDGYYHARSIDSKNHDSRNLCKNLLGSIAHELPIGWRLCAENLYAKHSISYSNLDSYAYVHSIWNENNMCLSVDDTIVWCELLGIPYVPLLYRGFFDIDVIQSLFKETYNDNPMEGYVVRLVGEIPFNQFSQKVAKFVRKGHVQTNEHWMTQEIIPNKLKENL